MEIMKLLKNLIIWIFPNKNGNTELKIGENLEIPESYKKMPLINIEDILLRRVKMDELSDEHQNNIKELHRRINSFFEGYIWPSSLPKKVNDGYRRPQDIPKNGSATSWHFKGAAIDLDDDDAGTTWKYVWANRNKLKSIGLWVEHPNWTHGSAGTWIHFQIYPPKSGKRFFIPSVQPAPAPTFWDGKYEIELDKS